MRRIHEDELREDDSGRLGKVALCRLLTGCLSCRLVCLARFKFSGSRFPDGLKFSACLKSSSGFTFFSCIGSSAGFKFFGVLNHLPKIYREICRKSSSARERRSGLELNDEKVKKTPAVLLYFGVKSATIRKIGRFYVGYFA